MTPGDSYVVQKAWSSPTCLNHNCMPSPSLPREARAPGCQPASRETNPVVGSTGQGRVVLGAEGRDGEIQALPVLAPPTSCCWMLYAWSALDSPGLDPLSLLTDCSCTLALSKSSHLDGK